MTPFALIFTLSAIGISETMYLINKRRMAAAPVCPIGEDCSVVLESKYNKIAGIQNDLLGLLFYIAVSFLSAFLVIGVEPLSLWSHILPWSIFFGALMSAYFFFLQWKVIRAWCFWCLMSASTIWLMAIIVLLSNQI